MPKLHANTIVPSLLSDESFSAPALYLHCMMKQDTSIVSVSPLGEDKITEQSRWEESAQPRSLFENARYFVLILSCCMLLHPVSSENSQGSTKYGTAFYDA